MKCIWHFIRYSAMQFSFWAYLCNGFRARGRVGGWWGVSPKNIPFSNTKRSSVSSIWRWSAAVCSSRSSQMKLPLLPINSFKWTGSFPRSACVISVVSSSPTSFFFAWRFVGFYVNCRVVRMCYANTFAFLHFILPHTRGPFKKSCRYTCTFGAARPRCGSGDRLSTAWLINVICCRTLCVYSGVGTIYLLRRGIPQAISSARGAGQLSAFL